MTPRSLLDTADVAEVRARLRALGEPPDARTAAVRCAVACLLHAGVLQTDPDDPDWPDRDRLVVAGDALADLVASATGLPGAWTVRDPRDALVAALGLAEASRIDGGIYRVWCLLDESAAEHGMTWEAARAAVRAGTDTIGVLALAGGELLEAAGWRRVRTRWDEPVELLAGLDQVLDQEPGAPPAVLTRI